LLYNTDPIPETKPTPKAIGSEMPTNPPAKIADVPAAVNNGKFFTNYPKKLFSGNIYLIFIFIKIRFLF